MITQQVENMMDPLPPSFSDNHLSTTSVTDLLQVELDNVQASNPLIMAICTDSSRCGCAIYADSSVQLVADRKDSGDPYKGLDIIIQRIDPQVVIVSAVQTKLITFLEKRFKFKILDLSRNHSKRSTRSNTQHQTADSAPRSIKRPQLPIGISQSESVFGTGVHSALPGNSKDPLDDHDEEMQIIDSEGISDISECAFTLAIVPNTWFSISRGFQRLIDSEFVKSKGFNTYQEQLLFISSRVEKSIDVCAVRAVSALDNYITHAFTKEPDMDVTSTVVDTQNSLARIMNRQQPYNQQSAEATRDVSNLMTILDVRYVDPGPVLSLDKFTLESLGIFKRFPKKFDRTNDSSNSNQDFEAIPSLYEVLNQCHSPQGKRQLRTMMLWPLQDTNELRHRFEVLEYFIKPENQIIQDQLAVSIKNVVPLSSLLVRLSHSIGTYKELNVLYKALWSFISIIDIIRQNPGHGLEIFNRIKSLDTPELRARVKSILNVVDFEASRKERRIQVCLGVDEMVDEKKEFVQNLAKICDEVAIEETARYKDIIGKVCRVLYIPRIGFLNSFDYSSTTELMKIRTSRDFDVLLHTEQSVYFKTKRMEELDDNAGDVACDLIDVQEIVVSELQNQLLKHTETVLRLMELCGELDCLIAFAVVSRQRGYTRPEFTDSDEVMDIKQAYHPLNSTRLNMIPNDALFYKRSSERKVKVMVITGPNASGKTTYMEEICIVVYMAHIGCFVPALRAKIPVVDAIFTRMHSANSISTGLSSFATDLHQINYALGRATERSLIAVDEFGKGTQARDGFHLLKGLVTYFATQKQQSPYVMVTTHFNRLINHLQTYGEYILYKTFKVTKDPTKDDFVYEFKMIDGVGEASLADQVAARVGIPPKIIQRANQVRDYITEGRPIKSRAANGA